MDTTPSTARRALAAALEICGNYTIGSADAAEKKPAERLIRAAIAELDATPAPNSRAIPTRYAEIPERILAFFRRVMELQTRALDDYAPETFDDICAYEVNESAIPESTWDEIRYEHAELRTDPGDETLAACFALQFPDIAEQRDETERLATADDPARDGQLAAMEDNARTDPDSIAAELMRTRETLEALMDAAQAMRDRYAEDFDRHVVDEVEAKRGDQVPAFAWLEITVALDAALLRAGEALDEDDAPTSWENATRAERCEDILQILVAELEALGFGGLPEDATEEERAEFDDQVSGCETVDTINRLWPRLRLAMETPDHDDDPPTGITGPRADDPRCEDSTGTLAADDEDQRDQARDAVYNAAKAHYLETKDAPSLCRIMRIETENWPKGVSRDDDEKILAALTEELGASEVSDARDRGTLEEAFELFAAEEDFRAFDEAEIRKATRAVDEAATKLLADLEELRRRLTDYPMPALAAYLHRSTELARALAGMRCALDEDLTAADMALLKPAALDRLDLQAIMTARGELAELHNADELETAGILALARLDEILERNDPTLPKLSDTERAQADPTDEYAIDGPAGSRR